MLTDGLAFFVCALFCVWSCGCSKERVQKIERESRAKAEKDMARINDKATPKGQFAFDTISKMYETRWVHRERGQACSTGG